MTPEPPNHLVLDACCVINLFASRHLAEILAVLGRPVAVAAYVANEEALYIYGGPADNIRHTREEIELKPLIDANVLTVASLAGEQEQETFVSLARVLDDGEAMTAALAIRRGWSIATDDGRATNYLTAHCPLVDILTTPALLRQWVELAQPSRQIIRDTLESVRLRANYNVGPKHSLYAWWQSKWAREQS